MMLIVWNCCMLSCFIIILFVENCFMNNLCFVIFFVLSNFHFLIFIFWFSFLIFYFMIFVFWFLFLYILFFDFLFFDFYFMNFIFWFFVLSEIILKFDKTKSKNKIWKWNLPYNTLSRNKQLLSTISCDFANLVEFTNIQWLRKSHWGGASLKR